MRTSATRLLGALAIGGAVLGASACGPLDSIAGGDKKAACDAIETELRSLANSGSTPQVDPSNPTAALSGQAQKFADAATKIRSEGQKAGGDVESAATRFASDLDSTATALRGNPADAMSALGRIQTNAQDLGKACGFTSGLRF